MLNKDNQLINYAVVISCIVIKCMNLDNNNNNNNIHYYITKV